jgi:hypothetical protein
MKRKRSVMVAALGLALGVFIAPAAVFGQGSTWAGQMLARTMDSAMWRAGILRANTAFTLSAAGYDSDIFYGFFGEPFPDGFFSAGTPVQLLCPVNKTVVLEVYDSPRYDFYLKNEPERAWNNTFRSQLHLAFSKIYFRLGAEMADNRHRLGLELDINVRERTHRLDGLALWQLTRATSLAVIYDRTRFDYGDAVYNGEALSDTLNRIVDSVECAAFVHVDPHFRFFVNGQYRDYNFTGITSETKDTRSYAAYGGFVSVFREGTSRRVGRIDGHFRLGYMKFDVIAPGLPDGDGLVGDVDLTVGIFRSTDARLFYAKAFEFSVYEGATFYAEQTYGGGLTRRLSRRTALAYDLMFGQSSYPQYGEGGDPFSGTLFRYTTHRVVLSTELGRFLRVSLMGSLGRRLDPGTGQSWGRSIVALSLEYGTVAVRDVGPLAGLLRASSGITN